MTGRQRDLSGLVAERVASSAMAACGAAVVCGVESETYACGDAGGGVPVSTSTLFHICSCSKAFTAAAFARLVEQGKASWDMPIHEVLPEFVLSDSAIMRSCTMRDLASMRLGLSRDGIAEWGFRPDAPVLARLSRAAGMAFDAPFRDHFSYSNMGYIALAVATARLAGMDYARCMQELVFSPLGLKHATLNPTSDAAKPHMPLANGMQAVPELTGDNSQGSARVHLCAQDAGTWLSFLLRAARGDEGSTIQQAFQPQIAVYPVVDFNNGLPVALAYGFGWHVSTFRGRRLFNHGGGGRGWRAMALLDPECDTAVMVFASHEGVGVEALALTLLDQACGETPEDWDGLLSVRAKRETKARNAAMDLREKPAEGSVDGSGVRGVYANTVTGRVHIETDRNALHFRAEDAPAFNARLAPLSDGVLKFEFGNPAMHTMPNDPLFQARFLRRPGGRVALKTTYFGTLEKTP